MAGIHLHIHPKFYKVLALSATGVVALFIGLLFYSASPSFCISCHIMRSYYDAWKTSKHNKVACIECHYPPQTEAAIWVKVQSINSVVQ